MDHFLQFDSFESILPHPCDLPFQSCHDIPESSDAYEDTLTKDTSTTNEYTRFEEDTAPNIEILSKKIQKVPKKTTKPRKKDIDCMLSADQILVRGKRDSKKPICEYEKTQIEDAERKKTQSNRKKKQVLKEKLIKTEQKPSHQIHPVNEYQTEASYKNRDWKLFLQQELQNLNPQEFLRFLKIVY